MDDATLLGYLLHALDPEAHRRVEAYLLSRPQAWGRVARLRRSLAALAEDEPPRPPPALAARTLARLADARRLPDAPPPSPGEVVGASRGGTRRPDVLPGALLLAAGLLLGGPWLGGQRQQAWAFVRRQQLA